MTIPVSASTLLVLYVVCVYVCSFVMLRWQCEDELRRLQECKAASLKELIAQARVRLIALWDECLISEEERQSFAPAYSTACTDESLEAHDLQIARMETRAQAIRPLLKLVARRDALLEDKRVLEESCLDPNRFRIPGRLIQEEKTRKMLQKRLPQVEQKLLEGRPRRLCLLSHSCWSRRCCRLGATAQRRLYRRWQALPRLHEGGERERREREADAEGAREDERAAAQSSQACGRGDV